MKYGFALNYVPAEGTIRFVPPGCTHLLVYSDDARTFWEEPCPDGIGSDIESPPLAAVAEMGKYKLDIAVRALFPRYRDAEPRQ